MNQADLEKKFFTGAVDYAKAHGRQFGAGAENEMREAAKRGAQDVFAKPAAERDKLIQQGDEAFRRLIDAMVSSANANKEQFELRGDQLGENTLNSALGKLCPLWPFCS
jgi:hypothetical protein